MKLWVAALVLSSLPFVASAQSAVKPCQDLKAEIAKKLDAKGVTDYTLTIVDKGKESEGKIVGTCDGGTKSIIYERATSSSQPNAAKKK
ncbi:MAG TPA: DUF1161 domain-containing protein [Terracidiphilus sp.]|nr:DUF1161 domain-containing protein [Terracidiphilus sp.]